jgi:flagellar motor switch protein FliN/FliY
MSDELENPAPEQTAAVDTAVDTAVEEPAAGATVAQAVDLPELAPDPGQAQPRSIELLLDVDLPLAVELGHSQMPIKSILELGVGSVIRLDKAAGDPVDVLVNGKLVARGEVVVVDENFGVRILGLVDPDQRLGGLK